MTERVQNLMPTVVEHVANNPVISYSINDVERMADYVAKSGLFGVKTKDQAVALMMLAQAEGMHPMIAARDWDIIQGRPAKKAEAMLRDFQRAGGSVEWHDLSDTAAIATFRHPQGGSVKIDWTLDRAKKAGLGGKDMWAKYPRQMLRSRCVSEGCKTVWPSSTSGAYTPEEVRDFEAAPMRDVTPLPQAQDSSSERSANQKLADLAASVDTPAPTRRGRPSKVPQEPKNEPGVIEIGEGRSATVSWIWIAPDGRFRDYETSEHWLQTLRDGLPSKSADDCTKLMSRMNDTFNQLSVIDKTAVEEAQRLINERFIDASNTD